MNLFFKPVEFLHNLPWMGKGMLGILAVILVIIAVTCILNAVTGRNK